jgi:hypothetical protein
MRTHRQGSSFFGFAAMAVLGFAVASAPTEDRLTGHTTGYEPVLMKPVPGSAQPSGTINWTVKLNNTVVSPNGTQNVATSYIPSGAFISWTNPLPITEGNIQNNFNAQLSNMVSGDVTAYAVLNNVSKSGTVAVAAARVALYVKSVTPSHPVAGPGDSVEWTVTMNKPPAASIVVTLQYGPAGVFGGAPSFVNVPAGQTTAHFTSGIKKLAKIRGDAGVVAIYNRGTAGHLKLAY